MTRSTSILYTKVYVYMPIGINMDRKTRTIRGGIETSTWSNGLEDDPWPYLIEVLERIAEALEKINEVKE